MMNRTTEFLRPLWRGPIVDGITQSLLQKFLVCRERFRLHVIEGWIESEGFSHFLESGNYWHLMEEKHHLRENWRSAVDNYTLHLRKTHSSQDQEIMKWEYLMRGMFPVYLKYWKGHKESRERTPLLMEEEFNVPYTLPSGRVINLRGKFDGLFEIGKGTWLQENKVKGLKDETGIKLTIPQNLQVMFYMVAVQEFLKTSGISKHPLKGMIYNVVRRPLSDQRAPRQRKKETPVEFWNRELDRVKGEGDYKDGDFGPDYFFKRWKVSIYKRDITRFKQRVLDPVLEQLMDWWVWIEDHMDDPFAVPSDKDLEEYFYHRTPGGGVHWQSPWGVYNSMYDGLRGNFFELLTGGSKGTVIKTDTLFPELEGEW